MPKFTLIKHADTSFDSEVTVTFNTDLLEGAKCHFEDFLKASGFEIPLEEDGFERRLTSSDPLTSYHDYDWDDAFRAKFGKSADVIKLRDEDDLPF
jgi:hypothetical protein